MLEESFAEMPVDSIAISGEMQEGFVVVWAIVDTESPKEIKRFNLYKTGQEIKADVSTLRYVGIAKIHVGMDLGMHIFELLP